MNLKNQFDFILGTDKASHYAIFTSNYQNDRTFVTAIDRLNAFLDFAGIIPKEETTEFRFNRFVEFAKLNNDWVKSLLALYFQHLYDRIQAKEIRSGTANNCKTVVKKVLSQLDNIKIEKSEWKKIDKLIGASALYSNDVAYTLEQINKLCEYSDDRIKPLVYVMATSGIRLGGWIGLKKKHIKPYEENGKVLCAYLKVYDGDPKEEYWTLISKEAYDEVAKWFELRKDAGENVTAESPVMRQAWDLEKGANNVVELTTEGIASLFRRAIRKQGLRKLMTDKGKSARHKFKQIHGLRKFHSTALRMVRNPEIRNDDINILTGHKGVGYTDNYYRPSDNPENKIEGHLLKEYLRAEEFLTIDPRNMKMDKLEVKITTTLENKYETQNKEIMKKLDEQNKMIEMMKKQNVYNVFENVIEKLMQEKRALKQYGSISVDEQFEYFMKSSKAKWLSKDELELLMKMVDSNEILPVGLSPPDEDGEGLDIKPITKFASKNLLSQIKKLEDSNKISDEQKKQYKESLEENLRIAESSN